MLIKLPKEPLTDDEAKAALFALEQKRVLCLVCGEPGTRDNPLFTRDDDRIETYRHGIFCAEGYAHLSCRSGEWQVNVTGLPAYDSYNEDLGEPPYPPRWDCIFLGQMRDIQCQFQAEQAQQREAFEQAKVKIRMRLRQLPEGRLRQIFDGVETEEGPLLPKILEERNRPDAD